MSNSKSKFYKSNRSRKKKNKTSKKASMYYKEFNKL